MQEGKMCSFGSLPQKFESSSTAESTKSANNTIIKLSILNIPVNHNQILHTEFYCQL